MALFSIVKVQQGGPVLYYQKHPVGNHPETAVVADLHPAIDQDLTALGDVLCYGLTVVAEDKDGKERHLVLAVTHPDTNEV